MKDIIEMLLIKRQNLREDLEREYAERERKINDLLEMAGYVAPVEETDEEHAADAVADIPVQPII